MVMEEMDGEERYLEGLERKGGGLYNSLRRTRCLL